MKKIFIILGFIASLLAIILSVLPISNLSVIPAVAAFIFALIAFYLSKKSGQVKKIIPFVFILTLVSLTITAYKAIFNKAEITDTQELEHKEAESKEDAIDELETLNLEDLDVEDISIEE